jgi:nucleoside-diphosphate-sugar epimerase
MQILVTGADGFIGRRLCSTLKARGLDYRGAFRLIPKQPLSERPAQTVAVGNIGPNTEWTDALAGITTVVHLAARVHVLNEHSPDSLEDFRRVNVTGTERLARMSVRAGVRRLIYISTVKVHGDATGNSPVTEASSIQPRDAYGISKFEAEQSLQKIAAQTGLEVTILRPPVVYGPGVKGNFLRLMRLVARGVPLPLASVANRRSMVYVDNLASAIVACVEAPAAGDKTYVLSDEQHVSSPELIRSLAAALRVPARLFPFPATILSLGAAVLGKGDEIARLTASLEVDSSSIRSELGWRSRFTLREGLEQTARWYRSVTRSEGQFRRQVIG